MLMMSPQVTASGDQTVRMWDVSRDECLAVFKGHSCSVKSVDFREDDICKFSTNDAMVNFSNQLEI